MSSARLKPITRARLEGDDATWPFFPIVMLHRIVDRVPSTNPYGLCMSVDGLDRTIKLLRRQGFQIVSLQSAVEAHLRGEDVRRFACLTFDDGYRDFATHAFPVLEHNDAPATVFLVADHLGGWNLWDAADDDIEPAPLLSRREVLALAAAGIEFGSHSASHPLLSSVGPQARTAEVEGSKRMLESLLGREVTLFAYPHIDQDEDVQRRVAASGYLAAVGGEQAAHSRYLLHRISLPRLDALSVRFRTHGWRHRAQRLPALQTAKRAAARVIGRGTAPR